MSLGPDRSSPDHLLRTQAYGAFEHQLDLRGRAAADVLWHTFQTDGRHLLVANDGVEKCFRISKQVRPLYVPSDERFEALLLINLPALLSTRAWSASCGSRAYRGPRGV